MYREEYAKVKEHRAGQWCVGALVGESEEWLHPASLVQFSSIPSQGKVQVEWRGRFPCCLHPFIWLWCKRTVLSLMWSSGRAEFIQHSEGDLW